MFDKACKSKTHQQYADAIEGLRIQTMLIQRDTERAATYFAAHSVGQGLNVLETIAERVQFAQDNLADATKAVSAHMDRGCRNLAA